MWLISSSHICVWQVTLKDQVVTEGDDITMRVHVQGQPKPLIYWWVPQPYTVNFIFCSRQLIENEIEREEIHELLILCPKSLQHICLWRHLHTFSVDGSPLKSAVCVSRLRGRLVIKASNRHTLQEAEDGSFEMRITAAQKTDTGLYTCKIVNEYGMKQCDCHLEVIGESMLWTSLAPTSHHWSAVLKVSSFH